MAARSRSVHRVLLFACLFFQARLTLQQCLNNCPADPDPGQWVSQLTVEDDLLLTWAPDTFVTPAEYFIEARTQNNEQAFVTINQVAITDEMFSLDGGLEPNTIYDVRVCRAMKDDGRIDNCGDCTLCVDTGPAAAPPSPPTSLMFDITSSGSIIVTWGPPQFENEDTNGVGVTNYTASCNESDSGIPVASIIVLDTDGLRAPFTGLSPNTMYDCSVIATNTFGSSEPATETVSTLPRITIPGALLVHAGNTVYYAQVADNGQNNAPMVGTFNTLFSTTDQTTGMDYNFERSWLFLATDNNGAGIERLQMDVSVNAQQDLTLVAMDGPVTIHTAGVGVSLAHVTVDWVYNELYYVESEASQHRIMRMVLDDAGDVVTIYCAVEMSTPITNIIVDPTRGFFFWSTGTNLFRTVLSPLRLSNANCPASLGPDVEMLASTTSLNAFTIEQNDLYFYGSFNCSGQDIFAVQTLMLSDVENPFYTVSVQNDVVRQMDSFTDTVVLFTNDFVVVLVARDPNVCPGNRGVGNFPAPGTVSFIRMYRESKQPIPTPPSPPSGVHISTTDSTATLDWVAPLLQSDFSPDAFDDWIYVIELCRRDTFECVLNSTSALAFTFPGLVPDTSYAASITVTGPGGNQTIPQELVFTTKSSDFNMAELFVADETGVHRSGLGGEEAVVIDEMSSTESNSVAHDTYTDSLYWAIEGGQASFFQSQQSNPAERLLTIRDQPFGLELDWLNRQLFWVEDGETEFVADLSSPTLEPVEFSRVSGVESTVLDAINGLLFWTDRTNIMVQTLSGLDMGVCLSPNGQASSLAADVVRRQLYWLSSSESAGDTLTISQMEYNSTNCLQNSVTTRDLSQVTFSSSSTILAYASNTLFVSNRGSDTIYTVSSDLPSVGPGQTLAAGTLTYMDTSTPLQDIRDISVTSRSLQPLGGVSPELRGLDQLRPRPPLSRPVLGGASTTDEIVIEWGESPPLSLFPDSPLFYMVEYSLERMSTEFITETAVVSTNSLTLTGQEASTMVTANITTFSLWTQADSFVSGTFISLPDRPDAVTNVQVFIYRPNTDNSVLTGLVTWDPIEFALNYTVTVRQQGGTEIPNLFMSPFPDTSYVILQFNPQSFSMPSTTEYPLVQGQSYEVEVIATNEAGSNTMTPLRVPFTVDEPNYPQQVLAVGADGGQILGNNLTIVRSDLSVSGAAPTIVDTIGRMAYWYSRSDNIIYSQSLHTGPRNVLLSVPSDKIVLALAFDWIGQQVYMLRRSTNSLQLEIMRVLIHDTDNSLTDVFPALLEVAGSTDSSFQLMMNPFTGFIYWTEGIPTGGGLLHRLNLRDTTATTSATFGSSARRRKRSQRIRSKRQTRSLSSIAPNPALAQDVMTGELLLSDSASGDIMRCNLMENNCMVEVDHADLLTNTSRGNVGLPATSFVLTEGRLYWSSSELSDRGVYAVDLSSRQDLIVISETIAASSLSGLDPGQQKLPANHICLSPDFSIVNLRVTFQEDRAVLTNTTIFIAWDLVTSPLRNMCNDVPFSIPPYTFFVEYEEANTGSDLVLFTTYTRKHEILLEDLTPFTMYDIDVAVSNEFTLFILPGVDYHSSYPQTITTLEGVPSSPTGFRGVVLGTSSVNLTWDVPDPDLVRGGSTIYRVQFDDFGSVVTNASTVLVANSTLLPPGSAHRIQLFINNGALDSPPIFTDIDLWPLVPLPTVAARTNFSFVVEVELVNELGYENIQRVGLLACDMEMGATITGDQCSCPFDREMILLMEDEFFMDVEQLPYTMQFNLSDLFPHTEYCVQGVGEYISGETTAGMGMIALTASGVPDAPETTIEGSVLMWTPPEANGSPIDRYEILARITGSSSDLAPISFIVNADVMELELQNRGLTIGTTYDIVVIAHNDIGPSNSSSPPITFTPTGIALSIPEIAGITVAGASLLAVILIIIIIICFVQCRTSKRDLQSLSYMYGPDHELINLRERSNNAHSSNPHYTWSREDYVCTDEELNLLNKFPRNNLKLENFIDRGEFGEVFQGTATDILGPGTGPTPVAVKTLRKGSLVEEQRKFLSEAALMANFNHPNIVKVLGVCVDNDPVYIIMELMPGGDLLKFLREAKMDHGPTLLTLTEQMQVALDVAHGCHYLEQQHFIHRDIAARNCLVSSKGSDRVVKIGDFGLAKDLYSSDYYQVEGQRKLPVRWMAPEALLQGKFTVESDIWSYGVLLWEIMTLGNQPYPGRINQEVLQFVTAGGRLDRPDKCPSRIYHLMQNCWKNYTSDRPHFDQILTILNNYLDRLKRPDSVYYSDSDTEEEGENNVHHRQGSGKLPSRTPSIREGIINLARSGSMKLRNSFRRHNSLHKREEHTTANSQQDDGFTERGPF